MAKDKILFDTRKEKITPEKFEELWACAKKKMKSAMKNGINFQKKSRKN